MKKFIIPALILAPSFVFAQELGNIQNLLQAIGRLVDLALPIVVGIALLAFFWGLARFVFAAGNDVDKEKGRNLMIWGIVALFVMVSVWGLVSFIGSALGVGEGSGENPDAVPVPGVEGLNGGRF